MIGRGPEFRDAGCLMSYGENLNEIYRRAANCRDASRGVSGRREPSRKDSTSRGAGERDGDDLARTRESAGSVGAIMTGVGISREGGQR